MENETVDEKVCRLASRVEQLESGLRDIYACGSISYAEIVAKRLLAGAHAEEK